MAKSAIMPLETNCCSQNSRTRTAYWSGGISLGMVSTHRLASWEFHCFSTASAAFHEIIERYRPGEDDPHLKVLQAAHISDDEYFSHMVLDDLNLIIRDIRETHKKDSESAPQTTVADELKENLEAVENFKGSRLEKLAVLYCKQLGINYKNLSEEEFRWLIRILQKSKKMGTPISQRKKR